MFQKKLFAVGTSLMLFCCLVTPKIAEAQGNSNRQNQNNRPNQSNPNRPGRGNPNRPSQNDSPAAIDLESELVGIAEATLRVEHDVEVNGNPASARRRNPNSIRAREANLQRRIERGQSLHSFLRGRKVGFRDFQTELEVEEFSVEGDVAVLNAVESTTLLYDLSIMADGSPEKSEEIVEHRFTFNFQNNQWELISDEILNAPGSTQGAAEEVIPVIPADASVTPSDPLAPPSPEKSSILSLSSSTKATRLNSMSIEHDLIYDDVDESSTLISQVSLNRRAIIQYIYYYALTPNTQYRNFEEAGVRGGDCTNFVSQALKAAGWPSEQGWYRSTTNWWYDFTFGPPGQSWTWINANYFFNFIKGGPRVRTIGRVANLVPGDVISVDFDPQNNNGMDHTMLVSKKSNDGTIYVAYHTNNTLDKSFHAFYAQVAAETNDGARYYAWSLSSSF